MRIKVAHFITLMTQAGKQLSPRIVMPFGRTILLSFAVACSLYLVAVMAMKSEVSVVWGIAWAVMGLASMVFYVQPARRYYAPILITIFFFLGYVLSLASIILNIDDIPRIGFGAIGAFEFTDPDFLALTMVLFFGLSGMCLAVIVAEKIFGKERSIRNLEIRFPSLILKKSFYYWFVVWFLFSVAVIVFMWLVGVGRTGITGQYLPFKLSGVLFYVKLVCIPFVGMLLLDMALQRARPREITLSLLSLLVVGAIGSFGGMSRGSFVVMVLPAVLYLMFTSSGNNINKKFFKVFLLWTTICASVIVFVVTSVRTQVYSGTDFGAAETIRVAREVTRENISLSGMFLSLVELSVDRIGGLRELMAVVGSDIEDISLPMRFFTGNIDVDEMSSITYSILGFVPYVDDTLAFGVALGMWGQLFLSRNYILVFLGTFLTIMVMLWVEELFLRKGLPAAAIAFSVILSFQVWGGSSLFVVSRFIAMLFLCYVFVLLAERKLRKAHNTGA